MAINHDLARAFAAKYEGVFVDTFEDVLNNTLNFRLADSNDSEKPCWAYSIDKVAIATSRDKGERGMIYGLEELSQRLERSRKARGADIVTGRVPVTFEPVVPTYRNDARKYIPPGPDNSILDKHETEQRKRLPKYGRY